jgi:hypothetical protein
MTSPSSAQIASTTGNIPSFFSSFSSAAAQDLMTMQLAAGQLEPSTGVTTVTNPIVPDRNVAARVTNFDPNLYDLRPQSHLMKLLKVLLGASGAGGLRKQSSVARLQNAFSGMHFLDLDRFYGALFGIRRTGQELVPDFTFDPYHDATDSDTWDDLHARDASYRSRLITFAKTIYYGGSALGLQSMAEALVGAQCNLYESWEWVDEENGGAYAPPELVFTYTFLSQTVPNWSALEGHTWSDWGGGNEPFVGRTGQKNRSEFVIQPKKQLGLDEQYELIRVLNTFKPAGTQFTVDMNGINVDVPTQLRGVAADSEYWEIVSSVIPNLLTTNTATDIVSNPYSTTPTGDGTVTITQQRPALSQYQGESWSYNGSIPNTKSYVMTPSGSILGGTDDETVVYSDGTSHVYSSSGSIMTSSQAISARLVSDGVLTAVPYAPARTSQNTAGIKVA